MNGGGFQVVALERMASKDGGPNAIGMVGVAMQARGQQVLCGEVPAAVHVTVRLFGCTDTDTGTVVHGSRSADGTHRLAPDQWLAVQLAKVCGIQACVG